MRVGLLFDVSAFDLFFGVMVGVGVDGIVLVVPLHIDVHTSIFKL